MNLTATYSPDDNKLRLYSSARLDSATYSRLKSAGFKWAPKQGLFVAPMWTPQRADLLTELCGGIEDEDKSLVQRAEERAERFENYSERRADDAEQARQRVESIAKHIPFGQPILVGHHSENRARRDAQRIDDGMRKAVKMWDTSAYWTERANGAIQAAKYKERPDVRARRIKKLEAEQRKMERYKTESTRLTKEWSKPGLTMQEAATIANLDHGYFLSTSERKDGKPYPVSLWDATQGRHEPKPSTEQIAARAIKNHERTIRWADRWLEHFANRLVYERAMLVQDGGIVADRNAPEQGGACKCWASPRNGWSIIQKVNKVSVTVLDNWGNGGRDFTRTIPFDKLRDVMSKAQVEAARTAGLVLHETSIGFVLAPKPRETETTSEQAKVAQEEPKVSQASATPTGIETSPRPITPSQNPPPQIQQSIFKPKSGPSHRKGMGL